MTDVDNQSTRSGIDDTAIDSAVRYRSDDRRIRTVLLPGPRMQLSGSTAVVIDVIRASTVIVTALASGAASVQTYGEVAEVERLRSHRSESLENLPLLCGERNCKKLPGFDLGNSPVEYDRRTIDHRPIALTTTNGTAAIRWAAASQSIAIASVNNIDAVAKVLRFCNDIVFVCAGSRGEVSSEDVLVAGDLSRRLIDGNAAIQIDDATRLAIDHHDRTIGQDGDSPDRWRRALTDSLGGRHLIDAGLASDLAECSAVSQYDIVPMRSQIHPPTFTVNNVQSHPMDQV